MPETLKIHEFFASTPSVPSTSIDLLFSSRTEPRLDKYQVEPNRRLKTFKSNRTDPIGSVRFGSVRFELNNTSVNETEVSDPSDLIEIIWRSFRLLGTVQFFTR